MEILKRKPVFVKMPKDANPLIFRAGGLHRILEVKESRSALENTKYKIRTRHDGFIWKSEAKLVDSGCDIIYNVDIYVGLVALAVCAGLGGLILYLMQ